MCASIASKASPPRAVGARWLDLGHAAVDAQFGTGDEAAVVGGQKHCGGCDLFRAAQPAERYRRGELCPNLVGGLHRIGQTVQDGGANRAGLNVLNRMPRSLNSPVQVRLWERRALLAL
jgi:hypothetical protein